MHKIFVQFYKISRPPKHNYRSFTKSRHHIANFQATVLSWDKIVSDMLMLQPQLNFKLPENYEMSFATWLLADLLTGLEVV